VESIGDLFDQCIFSSARRSTYSVELLLHSLGELVGVARHCVYYVVVVGIDGDDLCDMLWYKL
jgi:hypothetical protein